MTPAALMSAQSKLKNVTPFAVRPRDVRYSHPMATKFYEAMRNLNRLDMERSTEIKAPVIFEEPVECQCEDCRRDREVPMFLRKQAD